MASTPAYPPGPADDTRPFSVGHGWARFAILPASLARDPRVHPTVKAVLLALASYADAEHQARPSVAALARDTGVNRATVQRALAAAERDGYLVRQLPRDGRATTRYSLQAGAASARPGGRTSVASGAAPARPEQDQGTGPGNTPPVAPRLPAAGGQGVLAGVGKLATRQAMAAEEARAMALNEVFIAWVEATGKAPGRVKLTADRRRRILARLREGYTVEELVAAVRGWRHSPFHRGENQERRVWNDLELLLRNGAQVERFRDLEEATRARQASPRNAAALEAERRALEAVQAAATAPARRGRVAALLQAHDRGGEESGV